MSRIRKEGTILNSDLILIRLIMKVISELHQGLEFVFRLSTLSPSSEIRIDRKSTIFQNVFFLFGGGGGGAILLISPLFLRFSEIILEHSGDEVFINFRFPILKG
jgi:hypothetical protein